MTTNNEVKSRDELAANIRHWYWGYVRAVGGVRPHEADPEARRHPVYDGGTDKWGHTRQPIWPELAQWAVDFGIDVQSLLRDLAELHRYQKCLTPFELRQYPLDALEHDLAEHRRCIREDLFYRLHSELNVFRVELSLLNRTVCEARQEVARRIGEGQVIDGKTEGHLLSLAKMEDADIIREAIINSTLDLSALTRFCLACRTGMWDLVAHFYQRAASQYLEHPDAYDAVYGDSLPQEFRVAARARLD